MALTSASEISIVLSGGESNTDPDFSLGGSPSSTAIVGTLNNLFGDITADQAEDGYEDYRCFYIFNDGDSPVFDFSFWLDDTVGGASVELGVNARDEIQRITVGAAVTGGSMTLSYLDVNFTVNYNSDLSVWATDLQNALNTLEDDGDLLLGTVEVSAQTSTAGSVIFDIFFRNKYGDRQNAIIEVETNNLTPSTSLVVTVPQQGAPINTIAPSINSSVTPPGGVTFFVPGEESPIVLEYLAPMDGFPVWVHRIVQPGTLALANDGFVLHISAEAIAP